MMHAREDWQGMQRLAVIGARISFGAMGGFALIVILAGESGFTALLGADYAEVYLLAVIIAIGQSAAAFCGGTVLVLNMTRREGMSSRHSTWTAIANIALNALLIPFWGALGAAVATVVTTLAMQILAWNRVRKELSFRTDAFAQVIR